MDAERTTIEKPTGAAPHLIWLFVYLSIFWVACFLSKRDGFIYMLCALGAITLTLWRQEMRSTAMPKWLSVVLWVPAGSFLLLLAFVALRDLFLG